LRATRGGQAGPVLAFGELRPDHFDAGRGLIDSALELGDLACRCAASANGTA
jgi:hypothetical protein